MPDYIQEGHSIVGLPGYRTPAPPGTEVTEKMLSSDSDRERLRKKGILGPLKPGEASTEMTIGGPAADTGTQQAKDGTRLAGEEAGDGMGVPPPPPPLKVDDGTAPDSSMAPAPVTTDGPKAGAQVGD